MPPETRERPGHQSGATQEVIAATGTSISADPDTPREARHWLAFLDRHAAFLAGYELGKAERVEAEIEDQVLARLHAHAAEMLGLTRRLARAKGPTWAAMLTRDDQ